MNRKTSNLPSVLQRRRFTVRQAGFSLLSAIFLLVVLTVLGVAIVRISTTQSITSTQDLQGSRAYHAARAGAEWGVYQVMDPTNIRANATAPGAGNWPNFAPCPAANLVIEGFAVNVACNLFPYNEAGTVRSIMVYQIISTATFGVAGTANRVERQIQITVSKCRTTEGTALDFYQCA